MVNVKVLDRKKNKFYQKSLEEKLDFALKKTKIDFIIFS